MQLECCSSIVLINALGPTQPAQWGYRIPHGGTTDPQCDKHLMERVQRNKIWIKYMFFTRSERLNEGSSQLRSMRLPPVVTLS